MFKKKNSLTELSEYIRKNIKKGYTKESLKWALLSQGYSRLEVDKAFAKVDYDLAHEAPILKTRPEIKHEIIAEEDYMSISHDKPFWKRWLGM